MDPKTALVPAGPQQMELTCEFCEKTMTFYGTSLGVQCSRDAVPQIQIGLVMLQNKWAMGFLGQKEGRPEKGPWFTKQILVCPKCIKRKVPLALLKGDLGSLFD